MSSSWVCPTCLQRATRLCQQLAEPLAWETAPTKRDDDVVCLALGPITRLELVGLPHCQRCISLANKPGQAEACSRVNLMYFAQGGARWKRPGMTTIVGGGCCWQVHRAKIGEQMVVVKVQRPGLKELFDIDLKNIRVLAKILQVRLGAPACVSTHCGSTLSAPLGWAM